MQHDFAARFFYREIEPLHNFFHRWDNAEHEFIVIQVEQKRNELYKAVHRFLELEAAHTFTVEHERALLEKTREARSLANGETAIPRNMRESSASSTRRRI